jgi:hypothetical protein
MPDEDDRFGDVAEQLKQTEQGDQEDGDNSASEDDVPPEGDAQSSTAEGGQGTEGEPDSSQQPDEADQEDSSGGPAFSFDETDMHGFYVREETWNGLTRMRSSVTAACSTFDLSEFEGREFQDACLQVVADHGDEVALQILRERGIEADEERVREIVEMLRSRAETT